MQVVMSFGALCLLLVIGKVLRVKVALLRRLYLPTAVVGGLLGLLILSISGARLDAAWTAGWSALPGFLITIVFAALFAAMGPSYRMTDPFLQSLSQQLLSAKRELWHVSLRPAREGFSK